jgi:hypothetical protein
MSFCIFLLLTLSQIIITFLARSISGERVVRRCVETEVENEHDDDGRCFCLGFAGATR